MSASLWKMQLYVLHLLGACYMPSRCNSAQPSDPIITVMGNNEEFHMREYSYGEKWFSVFSSWFSAAILSRQRITQRYRQKKKLFIFHETWFHACVHFGLIFISSRISSFKFSYRVSVSWYYSRLFTPCAVMIYDTICDMIWNMIWYDIWYDMIWYDMIWYDMIW
jgi:hypothetical protein